MGINFINILTQVFFIYVSSNTLSIPFDIANPTIKIELSKELKEISGLCWYAPNQLAAVQDEAGILYLLDAKTGTINSKIPFSLPGDFEGIELVNQNVFALTSSGTLFTFNVNSPNEVLRINTPLSWKNNTEGLAYDSKHNRLLIACKDQGDIPDFEVKGKAIYGLSLEDYELSDKPILVIKKSSLQSHLKTDKFKPSALAIDPITNNLYVVASAGNLLVILNTTGIIQTVVKLPSKIYGQPEGICFSPNGDLYISNEGGKGKANIYHLIRR